MKIPFSSFKTDKRVITTAGTSSAITVPKDFVNALQNLGTREVVLHNISYFLIVIPETFSNSRRDLIDVSIHCLEALYHSEQNQEIKKKIEEIYEKLVVLQELYDSVYD